MASYDYTPRHSPSLAFADSPPTTRSVSKLHRRGELRADFDEAARSQAGVAEGRGSALPTHRAPVFNATLAISFIALLWSMCLTPILWDGSVLVAGTLGDRLSLGVEKLLSRRSEQAALQELDHDIGELIDSSQDFAGSVQFLRTDFLDNSCEDWDRQRCIVCPREAEVEQSGVEASAGDVTEEEEARQQQHRVDAKLAEEASKCLAELLLCEGRIGALESSLSEASSERSSLLERLLLLDGIEKELRATRDNLTRSEDHNSSLHNMHNESRKELQACLQSISTASGEITRLTVLVKDLERQLHYQQAMETSFKSIWRRVHAISHRIAANVVDLAEENVANLRHGYIAVVHHSSSYLVHTRHFMDSALDSARHELRAWQSRMEDVKSRGGRVLESMSKSAWARLSSLRLALMPMLTLLHGQESQGFHEYCAIVFAIAALSLLLLVGVLSMARVLLQVGSRSRPGCDASNSSLLFGAHQSSHAQIPEIGEQPSSGIVQDLPATPETHCNSPSGMCIADGETPEVRRNQLRELNARCFELESEVEWLREKLEESNAVLHDKDMGRWAEASAESLKLKLSHRSESRDTPDTPQEATSALPRDVTPDRQSDVGVESSCSTELPMDIERLWLRVKQAETGEAQAVQELTARMDAQTKLARALAEHEKEQDRLEDELAAYREHAADLEDELAAQSKELKAAHAQFDKEREVYQAHVSQLVAEGARMHSLREHVVEMQELADIMDDIMAGGHFDDQEGDSESPSSTANHELADVNSIEETFCPNATTSLQAKLESQEQVIQRLQAECAERAAQTEATIAKMELLEARLADMNNAVDLPGTPGNAREALLKKRAELVDALRRENLALHERIVYLEHTGGNSSPGFNSTTSIPEGAESPPVLQLSEERRAASSGYHEVNSLGGELLPDSGAVSRELTFEASPELRHAGQYSPSGSTPNQQQAWTLTEDETPTLQERRHGTPKVTNLQICPVSPRLAEHLESIDIDRQRFGELSGDREFA